MRWEILVYKSAHSTTAHPTQRDLVYMSLARDPNYITIDINVVARLEEFIVGTYVCYHSQQHKFLRDLSLGALLLQMCMVWHNTASLGQSMGYHNENLPMISP